MFRVYNSAPKIIAVDATANQQHRRKKGHHFGMKVCSQSSFAAPLLVWFECFFEHSGQQEGSTVESNRVTAEDLPRVQPVK